MIGMNAPDSAALLGVVPPHLSSSDLVKIAFTGKRHKGPQFKLDTEWDKATHFESWYFRSDHFPYAKKEHSGHIFQYVAACPVPYSGR